MIRDTIPEDTPILVEMTEKTGVFKSIEIEALQEVLDDFFSGMRDFEHRCVTLEENGTVLGYAYFAPTPMTDRTWQLWWIAVSKVKQAKGLGSVLLRYVEDEIRTAHGRILLIETSSLPHYELTRKFYIKHGYELESRIRDYYSNGDDLNVFRKRLDQ
jgi:GNAT superfamily N-acetyltransferase